MHRFAFLLLLTCVSGEGTLEKQENKEQPKRNPSSARQLLYFGNPLEPVQDPQLQYNPYNFLNEKQAYPRIQPQVLVYQDGSSSGQPFLLQPGPPPGNFLLPQPQPGPNIFSRDAPPRPFFIAGYPKPAHVPAIEKDAEEIPVVLNRAQPVRPATGKKPEKIETFDNPGKIENPDKPLIPGEAEVLAAADKNSGQYPKKNKHPALKPGQRFFILNGQPQFSNYQFSPFLDSQINLDSRFASLNPNFPLYRQTLPQYPFERPVQPHQNFDSQYQRVPIQNFLLRNSVTGQISDVRNLDQINPQQYDSQFPQQNFVSLNQPDDFRQPIFIRNGLPDTVLSDQPKPLPKYQKQSPSETVIHNFQQESSQLPFNAKLESRYNEKDESLDFEPIPNINDYPYPDYVPPIQYLRFENARNRELDDEAVIIDAKQQDGEDNSDSEVVTPAEKNEEPSIAQAQPAAIALAGPGGVAAAGPRGTALAGERGLAVSSPRATAVAGPKPDESKNRREKQ